MIHKGETFIAKSSQSNLKSNADGIDIPKAILATDATSTGRRGKLDDRIAEHYTLMARWNSREGGTEAGRYIMLASMRAKGKSAFDADAINEATMNKRHMDMPRIDASKHRILSWTMDEIRRTLTCHVEHHKEDGRLL